jgi:hypothetical protein
MGGWRDYEEGEKYRNKRNYVPLVPLAERFSLTEPAISYAVRRGQRIAREKGYKLLEKG